MKLDFVAILFLSILYSSCQTSLNDESRRLVDYEFEKEIQNDSIAIKMISDNDSLFAKYSSLASKYFEYYNRSGATKTSIKAATKAFKFWDYAGRYDSLRSAFSTIDVNDSIWVHLAPRFRMSYIMEGDMEPMIPILEQYDKEVRNVYSKNFIRRELGDYNFRVFKDEGVKEAQDLAINYYKSVADLNIVQEDVERARKLIFELVELDIGKSFPNFQAKSIKGRTFNLSEFKGKVVLIEFWATWCGPCIPEIPFIKKLYGQYGDSNLEVVSISLDTDLEKLDTFIEENKITWIQVCDGKKWESELIEKFNAFESIPRNYVIDKNGIIRFKDVRQEKLTSSIEVLVAELAQ